MTLDSHLAEMSPQMKHHRNQTSSLWQRMFPLTLLLKFNLWQARGLLEKQAFMDCCSNVAPIGEDLGHHQFCGCNTNQLSLFVDLDMRRESVNKRSKTVIRIGIRKPDKNQQQEPTPVKTANVRGRDCDSWLKIPKPVVRWARTLLCDENSFGAFSTTSNNKTKYYIQHAPLLSILTFFFSFLLSLAVSLSTFVLFVDLLLQVIEWVPKGAVLLITRTATITMKI